MKLDQAINIEDLHRMAKRKLPKIIFDYIEGGVEDERGLERNGAAFHKHRLLPRYLVDVSKRDQSATVFGHTYSSPFGISPTGGVGLYPARRRVDAGRRRRPTPTSPTSCRAAATPRWKRRRGSPRTIPGFRLYAAKDATLTDALIGRARDAGVGALVLTVDVPVHPKRERNYRNGFADVRNGGVMEALKLKPSILLEAMTHPAWVIDYVRHGGAPTLGNWAPHAGNGASKADVDPARPQPDAGRGADLARPRTLSAAVSAPARGQGDPEPGRCDPRRRDRRRRDHRLEPWRPPARPGAGLARRVAGDQGGGRRQADGHARQRRAARRRHPDRPLPRRAIRLFRAADALWRGRRRVPGVKKAVDIFRNEIDLVMGQIGCPSLDQLGPDFLWRDDWTQNR